MKMLSTLARALACASVALALGACSALGLGGSSPEPSVSPRSAVLAAIDKVEPVLKEVTVLVAAGAISDNVADDIAQFGPALQRIAAVYLDGAESCVVVDAALTTDPATGRECEPSTLLSVYNAFDGEILSWMVAASARGDQEAAGVIGGARLVVSLVPKPVSAGLRTGYRDEPDVPYALFAARRAALKQSFEALLAAAAAHAGKTAP